MDQYKHAIWALALVFCVLTVSLVHEIEIESMHAIIRNRENFKCPEEYVHANRPPKAKTKAVPTKKGQVDEQ